MHDDDLYAQTVSEYFDFLSNESSDLIEEFSEYDDPALIAREICILLSVPNTPISETMFRFYTSPFEVNEAVMYNTACFFSGCGLMKIECDCSENSDWCHYSNMDVNPSFIAAEAANSDPSHSLREYLIFLATSIVDLRAEIFEC